MTPATPRPSPHWPLALAGTAVAYAVFGWAALALAIPPSLASPLYPSAGIAVACLLVYGWRVLPGVLAGAFAVNAGAAIAHGGLSLAGLAVPATISAGATLQAALATALVRRYVHRPLTLSEPRDIAVFVGLGAVAASVVSASVAACALWISGREPFDELVFTWCTWWAGDALGVLIGAPIALTLIGEPRSEWAARRRTVGATLGVATLLMALGVRQVVQWEEARLQAAFERDAIHASSNLAAQLQYPLHALEALRGVMIASDDVTREEMHRAAAAWLEVGGHLQALGWTELMPRAQVAAFEARVRAAGLPGYHVFDRFDSGFTPSPDDTVAAIRYIEPQAANAAALGVNTRSIAAARMAIDSAVRTDRPAASAGFLLTQDGSGAQTGVVIYQAVYNGTPTTVSDRVAAARGVVFVTLRMDDALRSFQSALPHYLDMCIVDTDPIAERRRLAGAIGCETVSADLTHVRSFAFAGRQWDIRVTSSHVAVPHVRERNALLFSLVGLLATSMLGALMLTVTGRTRRIEAAVSDRTAALQREIAERQRTEADLRESEQRFRNILNHVPIGVVYTDLHGNVKQVNPQYCDLTGYSAEALVDMNVAALTHPDDRAQDLEMTSQLLRGEIPMYRRQGRYVTRDGRQVWVQTIVTLLRDLQGQPRRIVGVVEDITEHLRLAEAERARELAEAANHAKSDFLSRMSHELRTPLNAMLGFAQLLELDQNHPLPIAQRPWVTQIQSAGWHLLDMINDVLDLSRIESGTLNLQSDAIDLHEAVAAALSLVEQDARRRGITITQDLSDSAARVTGDATRVKQILINLLSNAVKYNTDGGRIHVTSRRGTAGGQRDCVEITITDTGLGMTPQQLSQLFQPFNRLGRERSALEGTGIGLVISQRLAELMGGSVRARSTAGEGSAFILTLPRATPAESVPVGLDDLAPTTGSYHQRIVHYVEDNETNVEVMRGILARRPQVQFDVSVTGLDGLAAIRARRPDLILLDMHLPDIDGMELLRHLKADPGTAGIPVVVVSADALASQVETALAAGARQYLTKPVSVSQLLGVVDAVLDDVETRFG